jgi:hypothetical protein
MRRTLAILFTAAPLVAGAVAAASARHDLRILCMAIAATVVVHLSIAATLRRGAGASASLAFGLATVAAAAVAMAFGARALIGIMAISVVLAGSATAGAILIRRARPRTV